MYSGAHYKWLLYVSCTLLYTLLENLTDDADALTSISMWRNFRPFLSIWRNFTSHRTLQKRHQSHTGKSAKTFLTVNKPPQSTYIEHWPLPATSALSCHIYKITHLAMNTTFSWAFASSLFGFSCASLFKKKQIALHPLFVKSIRSFFIKAKPKSVKYIFKSCLQFSHS